MDIAAHVARVESDGALLADAAEQAGWDAAVPGLTWDVRTLITHVGGVHRWAASVVRDAAPTTDTAEGRDVGVGPRDDELLGWFREGCAELVATLRSARTDLTCAAFLPAPSPLAFWARRQAHETAIHRADAEAAAGSGADFGCEFAQDGIAEMVHGFAARRSMAVPGHGVLALRATDGASWQVTLGGERTVAEVVDSASGDATVAGTSSQLYLWLWNRPADVTISGDAAVAASWGEHVRVRWS